MHFKFLAMISILLLIAFVETSLALPTDEERIVVIQDKWTKVIGSGVDIKSLYLFSDERGNVYSIQDTFWHWNFESANRYAKIQKGQTYRISLFGIRNGFMSLYQNAWKIEEVN